MKHKLAVFLVAFVVAMGLLLGASTASAAVVVFGDSTAPTKATNIFDLEVDGTLYDVRISPSWTASEIYGPFPGQFPFFNTATAAEAARDAINSALIEAGATAVGTPVGGTPESALFNIGFESSTVGDVELVTTAPGVYVEATWTSLPNKTWAYNTEPSTYAEFFAKPPEPTGRIGGTLTGLTGIGLVLQLNSTSFPDPIDEDFFDDGPFRFDQTFLGGTNYDVTVLTQPEGQICSVENGSGDTPESAADVTDILVVCDGDAPPPEPVVLRDCPGGAIVGGVYSAIVLTDYEDCVITDVVVLGGGVIVRNPRAFSIINSYVKGTVRVIRDNKSLEPSTAILINNYIDGGDIVIKELDEADVRRNAVYGGDIWVIDSQSQPDQYAEVFGNRIKGGNLKVNHNLSADVKWNSNQDGAITCWRNLVLDANGNEATQGTLRCGNDQ